MIKYSTFDTTTINNNNVSFSPCSTLCDPKDCSPQGSFVHGILQTRILEWVATPISRGSLNAGLTQVSHLLSEPLGNNNNNSDNKHLFIVL